jgi:hypothetical protein
MIVSRVDGSQPHSGRALVAIHLLMGSSTSSAI